MKTADEVSAITGEHGGDESLLREVRAQMARRSNDPRDAARARFTAEAQAAEAALVALASLRDLSLEHDPRAAALLHDLRRSARALAHVVLGRRESSPKEFAGAAFTPERAFEQLLADRDFHHATLSRNREPIIRAAAIIVKATRDGRRVYWCGNGGSMADAQHMAAEGAGRYRRERVSLPWEALAVNPSEVTAIGNDYGYEQVFARSIQGKVQPGDVLVAITTSGTSPNILRALEAAKRCGATTIALCGNGGKRAAELADLAIVGPDGYAAIIQETHVAIGHIICDLVEQQLDADRHAG